MAFIWLVLPNSTGPCWYCAEGVMRQCVKQIYHGQSVVYNDPYFDFMELSGAPMQVINSFAPHKSFSTCSIYTDCPPNECEILFHVLILRTYRLQYVIAFAVQWFVQALLHPLIIHYTFFLSFYCHRVWISKSLSSVVVMVLQCLLVTGYKRYITMAVVSYILQDIHSMLPTLYSFLQRLCNLVSKLIL